MPLQLINVGSAPNDRTGDSPREMSIKVNENFAYLANLIGGGGTGDIAGPGASTDGYTPIWSGTGGDALAGGYNVTVFAKTLLDDADATTARSTLGLGTAATTASSDYATAAHTHAFASLTGKPTTLSGYGITDAQPIDADLTAIAALTSAADRLPYFTGSGTAALATFTSAGRNLVDDADASAQRTTLGLGALATLSTVTLADMATQAAGTVLANVTGGAAGPTAATIQQILGLAPKFFATFNTPPTGIAGGVEEVLVFDAESLDTSGFYNPATGRFTPTVAGKYLILLGVQGDGDAAAVCDMPYATIYDSAAPGDPLAFMPGPCSGIYAGSFAVALFTATGSNYCYPAVTPYMAAGGTFSVSGYGSFFFGVAV